MPEISIIVPAYNAENVIERCLESCLAQTLKDIEILVVNDGSTDQTAQKILLFNDSRIVFFQHVTNRGQSAARNTGIQHSRGKYIGFVDADDTIAPDYYAKLLEGLCSSGADIAMGSTCLVAEKVKMLSPKGGYVHNFYDKFALLQNGSVWDKLYSTKLIKNTKLQFLEGFFWEDNLFLIQALWVSDGVQPVPDAVYNYIKNNNSTTQSPANALKLQRDSLVIVQATIDFMRAQQFEELEYNLVVDFLIKHIVHEPVSAGLQYYQDLMRIVGKRGSLRHKRNRYLRKRIFKFYKYF